MTSLSQSQRTSRTGRLILPIAFTLSILFPVVACAQVAITTTTLPVGNTSNAYYATLAATGGSAPYTWQVIGGTLPTGLNLSSTGVISGPATLTTGTPPQPATFTVQVSDSLSASATQTYSITVLAPGSHSLVINQIFTGGNAGSVASPSPYQSDYVEVFNAGPVAVDLQNWTLQFGASGSAFAASGVAPIGSLDPYQIGSTGGPNNDGNYPAFTIAYSSAFAASNCNPASASAQLSAAFPASHCWLNPGQYMLVLLAGAGGGANTNVRPIPEITADLDLGAIAANNNSGPVSGTTYVGHGGSSVKPGSSGGMAAFVNGVGIGVTCRSGVPANPFPTAVFSPLASDFLAYFAQNTAGNITLNTCWNGSSFPVGGTGSTYAVTTMGGAIHVSSSGKNFNALIRSAGNGKLNPSTTQSKPAYPAGTILPSTGVTLTPCGDTGNNSTDFAPITNGANLGAVKGQANWLLHNSSAQINPTIAASNSTPTLYTPTPCPNLNPVGPIVTAAFSQPTVGQGAGGGSVTDTLTVTVTPSNNPTSTLFNVNVNLSGVAGANSTAPLTPSSVGVPDGQGSIKFQEQISVPTTNVGTLTFPITVLDDAYRGGVNANSTTPLNAVVLIGSACQAPVATTQTLQLGWNSPFSITLAGQVGQNCFSNDKLTYAIQSQPLNGTLSLVSGNSVTYTPNSGFSGLDSLTFNVIDTSNSAGPLTSAVATVSLVVSATGVTPSLTLSCPAATYNLNPHGCTTALIPFVAGNTTISYNGSATAPTAAGSYPVSANFVSSGSPSQNTSAAGVLVVNQATPTLTILCPTVPYTGSPQGCTTPSVSGIGTAVPSGTISTTYGGSSTPPTNGGTYVVLASFTSSDPNYASATVTSSLTIYEPLVTITANSQTIPYGGVLPTFTYAVSPSIFLQTNPVCTSSATGSSNVGTYTGAITCSGAVKAGALFTYVAGSMTVVPGAATVTANSQTMVAGAAVPALTFATTPSVLTFTTTPKCTTSATSSSPVGTYPISCAGAVASNYTLSYIGGTITVTVPPIVPNSVPTITGLSTMTVPAGSPNLTLTVTGGGFVSGATVLWNGSTRATTFVNGTQLTATILAADLTSAGTADVAVFNPAPGGGASASLTFSIDSGPQAQGTFTVTGSSPALTVVRGQSGTTSLTFSNLQQGAAVSAVCYNLPAFGYCNYSNGTLTISTGTTTPAGTYHVLVVCSTSAAVSSSNMPVGMTALCGLFGFPIGLLMLRRRRFQPYGLSLLLGALLLTLASGCGGKGSNQSSPVVPAQASTTLTLTVQ
jgi:hypothetical protein